MQQPDLLVYWYDDVDSGRSQKTYHNSFELFEGHRCSDCHDWVSRKLKYSILPYLTIAYIPPDERFSICIG